MASRHRVHFWPLVPAVDIQAVYEASRSGEEDEEGRRPDFDRPPHLREGKGNPSDPEGFGSGERVHILIVGDGIGCLIKTLARMGRHKAARASIYVVSHWAESFARQLLLLSLFYDATLKMGVSEKSEIFLEIFGNTRVRASTSAFLETESGKILGDILNTGQEMKSVPVVSLDLLKQKEVDAVVEVFGYLRNRELGYDVEAAWESSLRAHHGTRYDSRQNICDYRFNVRLSHYSIIGLERYLSWCESGIAFRWPRGRYEAPNKSLRVANGSAGSQCFEPYWGDVATSPYITFGVEWDDEEVFRKVNRRYARTSQDASKLAVSDFMTEIAASEESERSVKIFFLFYSTFCKSRQFENFFDAVYVTSDMKGWAENHSLSRVIREEGVAMFETIHNAVYSTKEEKAKNREDIDEMAQKSGLKAQTNLKYCNDNVKVFKKSG